MRAIKLKSTVLKISVLGKNIGLLNTITKNFISALLMKNNQLPVCSFAFDYQHIAKS